MQLQEHQRARFGLLDGTRGGSAASSGGGGAFGSVLPTYIQRAFHLSQMDVEYAAATVAYLLYSPSKVYKLTQLHHEIKGHYARDDPAFVLILCAFISLTSVAYGLALGSNPGLGAVVRHMLYGIIGFFVVGALAASLTWSVANRYFIVRHAHSAVAQRVEWLYAFDTHCNAFIPWFFLIGVVQYLLLPLLLAPGTVACFAANTLYVIGAALYVYVTFLGFVHLPFLSRDKVAVLLSPCAVIFMLWVPLSVFNVDLARLALGVLLS